MRRQEEKETVKELQKFCRTQGIPLNVDTEGIEHINEGVWEQPTLSEHDGWVDYIIGDASNVEFNMPEAEFRSTLKQLVTNANDFASTSKLEEDLRKPVGVLLVL